MKILNQYKNGNTKITIYEDGTKVRETPNGETPVSFFPDNIDCKITDKCDGGCKFCHENSTTNGKEGNINYDFLETLHSGTEMAIGGGNVLESKDLFLSLLYKMKKQGVICSVTINQMHLRNLEEVKFINNLMEKELIYGLGVSFLPNDYETLKILMSFPKIKERAVIHTINGIHTLKELLEISKICPKILILGYKDFRRGHSYLTKFNQVVEKKQKELYNGINEVINAFEIVSFDNLSIEQLNIRRLLTTREWERFYMGNDATHTMYVDLVNGEFSGNSFSKKRWKLDNYKDIETIFKTVKEYYCDTN